MILNSLLESKDWEALGDDPDARFLNLLDIAYRKHEAKIHPLKISPTANSTEILRHRWELYTAIIGAAQAEEVTDFKDDKIQSWANFTTNHADAFEAKLNLYHARTKTSLQKRKSSIAVTSNRARELRKNFNKIREYINSSSFKTSKRDELLKRLQEIEDELNGKRSINIFKTARIIIELMMAPGAIFSTYDLIEEPSLAILKTMGELQAESSAEEEAWDDLNTSLLTYDAPLALSDLSNSNNG